MNQTGQRIHALSPEQRELLLQRLRLQGQAAAPAAPPEQPRVPDGPVDRHAPVPLTDVQLAYWIGRSGLFELGGCGANVYLEFEVSGSIWPLGDAVNEALRRVVARHEILRTVVLPDGTQRVLPEAPPYEVEIEDLSGLDAGGREAHLQRVREEMRYACKPVDRWPLFDILLHQIEPGQVLLHARFDAMVIDGRSRGVLLDEIAHLVAESGTSLPPLPVSYLDHSRALAAFEETATYRRAQEHWLRRIPSLPPPPRLPRAGESGPATVPRIVKRELRPLETEAWTALKRRAAALGLTPTAILTAAFAEALRPWCADPDFTLGVMGSYRPPTHPEIQRVIGNFNTVHLLAAERGTGSFGERAQRLQRRLSEDLEHQCFSGHRVMREIRRRGGAGTRTLVPVIFDSVVEYSHARYSESVVAAEGAAPPPGLAMAEVDRMISLPQVLIMCVAVEVQDGSLMLVSQAVEELFPEGLVPAFLEGYCALLARLSADAASWDETAPARPPEAWSARLPDLWPPRIPSPPEEPRPPRAAAGWTAAETAMAGLWEEILGHRPATPDDDFFALGGDSLLATRLLGRARERWGPALAASELLARSTLEGMSAVAERTPAPVPAAPAFRAPQWLAGAWRKLLPQAVGRGERTRLRADDGMRTFLLLWFSQFVSGIGTGLGSFALGIWVYRQNASVTQYSMFAFIATCTALLVGPLAGVLADRWDRKRLILLGDSGAAVMTGLMALALYTGQMRLWHVYIIVVVMVGFAALQGPAQVAVSSQLVSRRQLARVSGMIQASAIATGLVCPPLSGALVPVIGYHGVIAIDITTFLFAFVVLLLVRLPRRAASAASRERRSILGDLRFGWDYLRQRPGLLNLLWIFAATNFALSIVQVLLTPLVLSFGSATNLGFVNSATAAGGLIGSLVLSIWGGPKNRMNGILLFLLLQAPILLLGAVRPDVMLIAVACFIFAGLSPLVGGLSQAIWQGKVAHEVQGRVFAMRGLVVSAAAPLAYLLAGPLADRVFEPLMAPGGALAGTIGQLIGIGKGRGVGLLFMSLGLLIIVVVFLSSLNPRLRKVESELPDAVRDSEPEASPDKAQAEARPPVENDRLEPPAVHS
jgi:MFS family permease